VSIAKCLEPRTEGKPMDELCAMLLFQVTLVPSLMLCWPVSSLSPCVLLLRPRKCLHSSTGLLKTFDTNTFPRHDTLLKNCPVRSDVEHHILYDGCDMARPMTTLNFVHRLLLSLGRQRRIVHVSKIQPSSVAKQISIASSWVDAN